METTKIDYATIAARHGLTAKQVKRIWNDTFEFIHKKASSFDFLWLTDEEVDNLKSDFLLPGFGMLQLNRKRMRNRIAASKERVRKAGKQLYVRNKKKDKTQET